MKRQFTPERLDVRAFAEDGGELSGGGELRAFPRLATEAQGHGAERPVHWSARGELLNPHHVQPQVWLHLEAHAVLPLTCQRCLEPVDVAVDVERSFRFVADEKTAAAQDDDAEEDLLAISRAFDLPELVEDELLMGLPVVPRHEVCPEPLPQATEDEAPEVEERPNPFAKLAALKRRDS